MTTTIALAGKGGVGKTTIAALLVKYLLANQSGAVLAIDADPSSNLNVALGMDLDWTVGDIREDMLGQVKNSLASGGAAMGSLPGGTSKREYLDYHIRSALIEGDRCDLIAMGRPEGPGCYCAVNHNLREVVDSISKNYAYVLIDNEAGMEHLSRRTTRDVDFLLVVSDPSYRGLVAAERISGYRNEMDIAIRQVGLVINRLQGELPPSLKEQVAGMGLPFLGALPADGELTELEVRGQPVVKLGESSQTYQALSAMAPEILGLVGHR